MQDTLIPSSHSIELKNSCPKYCKLQLAPYMDHNEFDYMSDLVRPFTEFIEKVNQMMKETDTDRGLVASL